MNSISTKIEGYRQQLTFLSLYCRGLEKEIKALQDELVKSQLESSIILEKITFLENGHE